MPLLVRLTDSQVEMTDGVVSQVTNRVHHAMRVLEQVGSGRLTIDHEALLPDLHIKPVHRDIQPGGKFCGAERAGVVGPSIALRGHFDPGAESDPLHRDELSPNLGDGLRDQAAAVWDCEDAGLAATSIPSVNLTP